MQLMETQLEAFAELAAREQIAAEHNPQSVQHSYGEFMRVNRELFFAMPIDVCFTQTDSYNVSLRALCADIENNNNLDVFTGGTLPDSHPLAARDYGIYNTPNANEVFRAVHDYYGHYLHRTGFGTRSELKLAAIHAQHLTDTATDALLCESVMQTCVYHLTGNYAEQKAFVVSDALKREWKQVSALLLNE